MTKPVLYTFPHSVWAAVAEVAAFERGADVDRQQVDLMKGENFEPAFLKLNREGTLPTLVGSDSKVYTNTQEVVSHLNSIGSIPQVAQATEFTQRLHEEQYDPNFALLLARNDGELEAKAKDIPGLFVKNRQEALERISASGTPEAAEFKEFYNNKKALNGGLLEIYKGTALEDAKNKFFGVSEAHVTNIGKLITEIATKLQELEDVNGFLGGQKPGEDDFHLIGWLARIASTASAPNDANGILVYGEKFNTDIPPSVVSYWNRWVERKSFKTVYAEGLH